MIVVNVFLEVDESKTEGYLQFVKELVEASRKDTGCIVYTHLKDLYEPNKYMIIENWESQEALDRHSATPHLQHFLEVNSEFLVKDPVIQVSSAD